MIDPELLDILVCPESGQTLSVADDRTLESLNTAIADGLVRTRARDRVRDPIQEALVREDGALLYPIRDDIPVMLVDEAIPLDEALRDAG